MRARLTTHRAAARVPRIARAAALVVALAVGHPAAAAAHPGEPIRPHDLWSAWTFDPWVMLPLLLSVALYALGVRALWTSAGVGHGLRQWEVACFAGGWVTLAIALVSPLHALGGALFSAHMVQHEMLMVVAAPLLVLGRPLIAFTWALPPRGRRSAGAAATTGPVRRTWRVLTAPLVAFALHAIAIWLWHIPSLYDATIGSEPAHAAQHASFLLTALLFWYVVIHPRTASAGLPAAIALVFGTMLHTGALGALLTFSSNLLYTSYAATTAPWGLRPLEDQQLAGLIMWVPSGIAYMLTALPLFVRMLRESEARVARRERAASEARHVFETGGR